MNNFIPVANPTREIEYIKNYFPELIQEIKHGLYVGGPSVTKFEEKIEKFFNIKHAISLNSGTDALYCSLKALNVCKGDEVILPSFTFFATAEAVMNVGAVPVFSDVELNTFSMSLDKIKPLVTNKTKCIIPVHLYGHNADIVNIKQFANLKNIKVVEDCAQSFGSKANNGKFLGTFGNIGAFSTYPSKTLGGIGDGGFVITNNTKIYEFIKKFKNHGQSKNYEHSFTGINSRMDTINAFTLYRKIGIFDKIKKSREDFAIFYNELFQKFEQIVTTNEINNSVYNYFTIQVPSSKRKMIQEGLLQKKILTSVYYKKPLHLQKALKDYGYKSLDLTNTEALSNSVLSFPFYPFVSIVEMQYISKSIKDVFKTNEVV